VVAMLTGRSRNEASVVIERGDVLVDGAPQLSGKIRLVEGQTVDVPERSEDPPLVLEAENIPLEILYDDDDIIVVNKKPGMVVHPAHGHDTGTLVHALLALYPEIRPIGEEFRPGIVHRLDRGTSGLMVVARSDRAYDFLVDQLRTHAVTRQYMALVWGFPENESGTIDAPLGRRPKDPLKMAVVADGKYARTTYEIVERFREPAEVTQVRCWLETGRTHQIRVHLTAIGHAVVGDEVYGRRRSFPGVERPLLHAQQLSFPHPGSGELQTFTAPLPKDFATVLDRCS
jgi:23S rRNA pseudouridine1911/1915/1917 synthase